MLGWLLDSPGYNHNEILVGDWLVDLVDSIGHNHNEIVVDDEPAAADDEAVAAG